MLLSVSLCLISHGCLHDGACYTVCVFVGEYRMPGHHWVEAMWDEIYQSQ